jgi:gluconolactonase
VRQTMLVRTAFLATLTFLMSATIAAGQDEIWDDGFETGDVCAWDERTLHYRETFSLPNGSAWPSFYSLAGGLDLVDIQNGRGRLRALPSSIAPGRMVAPLPTRDVEVRFTFVMDNVGGQGIGLYVRQNGGWLTNTVPTGQGYVVFVEGFLGFSQIGLWRENQGSEEALIRVPTPFSFQDGAPYRVRFRVNQMTPTETLMQAKVWAINDVEPAAWNVTWIDNLPALQNIAGGIAFDLFNFIGSNATGAFDDVEIDELCNPLAGRGAVQTVAGGFGFTEGPVWRGNHLLFTDLGVVGNPSSAAIWRLTPPATLTVERPSSNYANGLALMPTGELVAAEHATRRLSITDPFGVITTLTDEYQGASFNSPNDIAVRTDGTIYFTDPSYGMPAHGQPREIAFNGLFRRAPDGEVFAAWPGDAATEQPNGVILSPDQQTLYASDTHQGRLYAWDVAADGALANQRLVRAGLDTPDGLCVDVLGNIFLATWDQSLQVMDKDGTSFGRIPLARDATNCAFGGADGRTLYITAQDQVYAVGMRHPGLP